MRCCAAAHTAPPPSPCGAQDVTPTTAGGRVVAGLAAIIGVLIMAIPIATVSTNFLSEYVAAERRQAVTEQQRTKLEATRQDRQAGHRNVSVRVRRGVREVAACGADGTRPPGLAGIRRQLPPLRSRRRQDQAATAAGPPAVRQPLVAATRPFSPHSASFSAQRPSPRPAQGRGVPGVAAPAGLPLLRRVTCVAVPPLVSFVRSPGAAAAQRPCPRG